MNKQMNSALSEGDQTEVKCIGKVEEVAQETICSTEVAEMVEVEHSKLLRSIRTYCDYLNEANIGLVNFFFESTYRDAKGETRPCYQVTKKGCEMIANKLTGQKGTVFTAKYIERFHQMQDYIIEKKNKYEGLSTEMQALLMLDKRSVEQDKRLTNLENNMTLDHGQQQTLNEMINRKVVSTLGGKGTMAYKLLSKKTFPEVYRALKNTFQVPSYRDIPVKQFEKAKELVTLWKPSSDLNLMIIGANAQVTLNDRVV